MHDIKLNLVIRIGLSVAHVPPEEREREREREEIKNGVIRFLLSLGVVDYNLVNCHSLLTLLSAVSGDSFILFPVFVIIEASWLSASFLQLGLVEFSSHLHEGRWDYRLKPSSKRALNSECVSVDLSLSIVPNGRLSCLGLNLQ